MLFEGECEGLGAEKAARKHGLTRQRYSQILNAFREKGAEALKSKKRGPKRNYRRGEEVVRQVIRHRFLDPDASAEVIAQKLRQCGREISTRSVERVVSQYGLQKKPHKFRPNNEPLFSPPASATNSNKYARITSSAGMSKSFSTL